MANQTLTDITRNYDDAAISGLLNGETINLNNGNLVINSDVRWGQQAAVFGNLTISATLGGSVLLDGRDVWWIPFDASSGNVPALGTVGVNDVTGSIAGAGEFLGVFTALGTAPLTAGAAMPASGFIKLRRKTADFADNEVLTFTGGATATVNSSTGGQRGWIHVVGAEASTATVPRLGTFTARGEWFQLGTTSGADDQTFQFPVIDSCPAIQIETAAGSGVYEWYLNAGSKWGTATQYVPTNAKGKFFGMDNGTGVITIARRATNPCGFKPPTGCRVRIPNIILSSSTATNWALNTVNATLATRYDFTTTSAGAIDLQGVCANWYLLTSAAYSVDVLDSCFTDAISFTTTATETNLTGVAVGCYLANTNTALTMANLFSGGVVSGCRFGRYSITASGQAVISVTDCEEIDFINTDSWAFGNTTAQTRGNATAYCYLFTRANNFSMSNCSTIGATITLSQCANVSMIGTKYADVVATDTTATTPIFAINVTNASINVEIEGFDNYEGIANQHPYSGILTILNSYFVTLKNVGTPSSPYNMGTANASGLIANAAVCANLTFRRVYTFNTRTGPFTFANTVQNVTCVNVWGDGADTQVIAALNITPQGCRWTNSVGPQASVYGRHWEDAFISTTAGRVLIAMNESLPATADQVAITAGTPKFTSGGQVAMPTVGDQVTWTMPYFAIGHTSLANSAPTITGSNTGNMTYEYQIDTGSGFGAWKSLTGANLSSESFTAASGFRLKVRATTSVANTGNALSYLTIATVTNATDYLLQYPLPFDATGSISGLVSGSRVQIYNTTTAAEIRNEIVSGTSLSYGYYNGTGVSAGDVLRIRIAYTSGLTSYLPLELTAVATATGFTVLAAQELDTVYNTNAISGSAVTELSADYPNIQIDSNDVDGETTVQRIYAWFAHNRQTASGIEDFFDALVADDLVNYRVVTTVVNLKIDNVIATPLKITGGRIYRDDETTIVAATSNSIQLDPSRVYAIETGTSGLTTEESQTLTAIKRNADLIPAAL